MASGKTSGNSSVARCWQQNILRETFDNRFWFQRARRITAKPEKFTRKYWKIETRIGKNPRQVQTTSSKTRENDGRPGSYKITIEKGKGNELKSHELQNSSKHE